MSTSDDSPRRDLSGNRRAAARPDSIVVYTAITGEYDRLKDPAGTAAGADFVAFVDEPTRSAMTSRVWRPRDVHAEFRDPVRNAKIHKILSHVYFPDVEYSLWLDGSVAMRSTDSIRWLVEVHLADCDLVVFRHSKRDCVYQEASICLQRRLDDPAVIWDQIRRYTKEGHPSNAGLAECTVVLRRHTAAVKAFNEAWWEEITRGSTRDQLSFPYVARKVGLHYGTFPGTISSNPLFGRERHAGAVQARPSRRRMRARSHRSWLSAAARAAMIGLRAAARGKPSGIPAWLEASVAPMAGNGSAVAATAAARDVPELTASLSRVAGRQRIAFGPVRDLPSWGWVGFDTARELSKYYDVRIYDSWSMPPDCDILFAVKERPPERFVLEAQRKKSKLIYCPIDVYAEVDQLARDADLLRACAMVLVHCERLLPLVRPYCAGVHFVDHHTRYATKEMVKYNDTGYILWIGGCQYVPYLVRWLEHHPIEHEIRILTDIDDYRARHAARVLAAEIGMWFGVYRGTKSIAGCGVYQWSELRQQRMMRECKGALDVKMTASFDQAHKPPTKAQQYVASGVPFAVNPSSYSAEYFRARGFQIASPVDTVRWLSREYWEETRVCGESLRAATSVEAVGARYRQLIEML
jgi:hypothetical protein